MKTSTFFKPLGSERIDPLLVVLWVVLLAVAVLWIAPVLFIVATSLKSTQ